MRQTIAGLALIALSCCPTVHADQCEDFEIAFILHQGAAEHYNNMYSDQDVSVQQNAYKALCR